MRALLLLALLLLLPAAVLAQSGSIGTTEVTVYVYSPPEVAARVQPVEGGLRCTWTIADVDAGDTFVSSVEWTRDGLATGLAEEVAGCTTAEHCAATVLAPARTGETWTCSVTVTDSYGAVGSSTASYSLTPLGFLRGFVEAVSRTLCSWLPFC